MESLHPGLWGMDALGPAVLCANSIATCAQDLGVYGYG